MRTSLQNTASGFTDDQLIDQRHCYETQLFRQHGKVVIDESDCGDNVIVLAWFKNLVKQRFNGDRTWTGER